MKPGWRVPATFVNQRPGQPERAVEMHAFQVGRIVAFLSVSAANNPDLTAAIAMLVVLFARQVAAAPSLRSIVEASDAAAFLLDALVCWRRPASKRERTDARVHDLSLAVEEGLATIALDRPEAANAINLEMGLDLMHASIRCDEDPAIRAVLITGNGRFFCAGGD